MGINASPTCVMAYDSLIKKLPHRRAQQGMRYMFKMMNNARLSVGVSSLALDVERACQPAGRGGYARAAPGTGAGAPGESSPIVDHPDVRRMLLTMRAHIEA